MQERQVSVGVLNKRVFALSGGGRSDEVGEKGALPRIHGFQPQLFRLQTHVLFAHDIYTQLGCSISIFYENRAGVYASLRPG